MLFVNVTYIHNKKSINCYAHIILATIIVNTLTFNNYILMQN